MNKCLIYMSIAAANLAYTTVQAQGNNPQSSALGNAGIASSTAANAVQINPALLSNFDEDQNFSMSLLTTQLSIEDPLGLADKAQTFVDETLEDFNNINLNNYNTALNGNNVNEPSLSQVFLNVATTANTMATLSQAILSDIGDGNLDNTQNLTDLADANTQLSNSTEALNAKIQLIEEQNRLVSSLTDNASEGLQSLSHNPAQLRVNATPISLAFPNKILGLGFSIGSNTTIGAKAIVVNSDLDQIRNIITDLNEFTAQVNTINAELTDVVEENGTLITLLAQQPQISDYSNNSAYQAALTQWAQSVSNAGINIENASDEVNTEVTTLQNFTTTNNTIVAGSLQSLEFTLSSQVELIGVNTSDLTFSGSHEFQFKDRPVSIGMAAKFQRFMIFEKTTILENASSELDTFSEAPLEYINENSSTLYRPNIDIGVVTHWNSLGKLSTAATLTDLIPWTLETQQGNELKIRPKLAIGIAHETRWTKLVADLDITENQPLTYGVSSRSLSLGGELSLWHHAAIRLGYRNNLSIDDGSVLTAGLGITPFGVGFDIGAWAKPEFNNLTKMAQDSGIAGQISLNF